ncbi:MAG TPA: serine hydrolase [Solirubrobacterales bacterium]|nr:serine hydrolase [Solirubrobacterales bacterium]
MKRAALLVLAAALIGAVAHPAHPPPSQAEPAAPAGPAARGFGVGLVTTGSQYPWRRRVRRAERFAAHRLGRVSFAVVGEHGRLRGHRSHRRFRSASVVKVMTAYLRRASVRNRGLRGADRALLGPMIRRSDNTAATIIRDTVGNHALVRLARAAGMRDFSPHVVWGLTAISAHDQARFMRRLQRFVPGRHRAYAFRLLATVVSYQRWGIPPARLRGWRLYFKGGWVPAAGGWRVNQVAQLRHGRRGLGVAVLTDGNPSLPYGARTITGVVRRLLGGYGAPAR